MIKGVTNHDQATYRVRQPWPGPCKGDRLRPRPHAGAGTGRAIAYKCDCAEFRMTQWELDEVIGSESRHCLRGRGSRPLATSSQGPADSNQPARGCRPRPALLPTGAAASVAGLAAPWQGGCQPQRVIAACAGAMATQ
ncbi:hypothetical protein BHM03_00047924 [Ensete ventricosum]|nr:hypothetical protein BHM03_00047924 [Ensete ventricosum]